jgi:DNA modification methylase
MTEIKRRRSLTNVGGAIETSGDRDLAAKLAEAIDVTPETESEAPDRAHVHGFHAYPARAHPVTARRLVEAFAPDDGTVLDPFCGSGTILIEAMLAGRAAIGTDLNPLAVMLARAKTFPRGPEKTNALVEAAKGAAEVATTRRKAKAGAVKRLPQADVAIFQPHVLLELDGIRAGIAKAPPEARPELSLVLSSILVKLSTTRGDTSDERVEKRIGAGYPSKLFVKKTEELARRMDEFAVALPSPPPRARVFLDDATKLVKVKDATIDAVITSPPYAVTYDYLAHHEMRMRWLGLDARGLAKGELGARRDYDRLAPDEAQRRWQGELAALFRALGRVTKPHAKVVLLIADSATARGPRGEPSVALRADDLVAEVAERGRTFVPEARASQARPHFHAATAAAFRDRPRYEHALLLRRR